MKTVTKFIYPVSAMFALACFALLPTARASTRHRTEAILTTTRLKVIMMESASE